jgi:hypothetical protein
LESTIVLVEKLLLLGIVTVPPVCVNVPELESVPVSVPPASLSAPPAATWNVVLASVVNPDTVSVPLVVIVPLWRVIGPVLIVRLVGIVLDPEVWVSANPLRLVSAELENENPAAEIPSDPPKYVPGPNVSVPVVLSVGALAKHCEASKLVLVIDTLLVVLSDPPQMNAALLPPIENVPPPVCETAIAVLVEIAPPVHEKFPVTDNAPGPFNAPPLWVKLPVEVFGPRFSVPLAIVVVEAL